MSRAATKMTSRLELERETFAHGVAADWEYLDKKKVAGLFRDLVDLRRRQKLSVQSGSIVRAERTDLEN